MKRIIAILIAILMLNLTASASYYPVKHKKHHFKLFKHKRHERLKKWNSGHTEFANRTKRDRKRLSRHHIKPIPEEKNTAPHKNKVKYSDKDAEKTVDKSKTDDKGTDAAKDSPQNDNGSKDVPKDEPPKDK